METVTEIHNTSKCGEQKKMGCPNPVHIHPRKDQGALHETGRGKTTVRAREPEPVL